jgi:hypothetical protein
MVGQWSETLDRDSFKCDSPHRKSDPLGKSIMIGVRWRFFSTRVSDRLPAAVSGASSLRPSNNIPAAQ